MTELNALNDYCLYEAHRYQSLKIYHEEVRTPYYINKSESVFIDLMQKAHIPQDLIDEVNDMYKGKSVPYGWHRGKGTPEEIEDSVIQISREVGLPLEHASANVILEFMKLYGLGIDCSGLVYNILSFAFSKLDRFEDFENILDWSDSKKKGVGRAGAYVFAGKASNVVSANEIRELDLVLIKSSRTNKYIHTALLLSDEGSLVNFQSQISNFPSGVSLTKIGMVDGKLSFGFKPEIGKDWETLYKLGLLEFRRLNINVI